MRWVSIYNNEHRIIKLLAIVANIFIIFVLIIIAKTQPARGYEISIYGAYPWYFWFFILSSIAIGILILLHQSFGKSKTNWWLIGLLIIIFSNAIFLGLPFFRGYFIYPIGDALTHFGLMKVIITTGHLGNENIYPMVHILGVNLLSVAGLDRGATANLLFITWYIIYLLNIFLLATVIVKYRWQTLLILALASPLTFSFLHTLISPNILSLFMIPLMLFIYHKKEKTPTCRIENSLLLILLASIIVLIHPVTGLFAIVIILIFIFSKLLHTKIINQRQFNAQDPVNIFGSYNLLRFMFVVFFAWYFSYVFIKRSIIGVFEFLIYGSEVSLYTQQINVLTMAKPTISEIIQIFIYKYGGIFIYFIISAVVVIAVLKWSLIKKGHLELFTFAYAIQFVGAVFFSAISLFGFTGEYDIIRISRFFLFMSPLVIGLAICKYIDEESQQTNLKRRQIFGKKTVLLIITLSIFIILTINVFNVYGSRRVVDINYQTTKMETQGSYWFTNHENKKVIIATVGVDLRRLDDLNFGTETPYRERKMIDPEFVSSHFGYNENGSIATTFNFEDRYLIISEAGKSYFKVVPESILSKTHQYTKDDYVKLNNDPTISSIYINGEFEVWRVYGKRNTKS